MWRSTSIFGFGIAWFLLHLEGVGQAEAVHQKAYNVVLIIADDLRPSLGVYGNKNILTPNIDQLARSSVVFTGAYAQQALCGPSRTSFLTSRRPDTTRLYDFYSYWRTAAGNFTTLPQYFKQHGYYAAAFGKVFHPGISSGKNCDMPYSWSTDCYEAPTQQYKRAKVCVGSDGQLHEYLVCPVTVAQQPGGSLPDIQIKDAATYFLQHQRPRDRPFFLAVGFHKPHIPLKYPKQFLDLYPLSRVDPAEGADIPAGLPSVAWNPWTDIREREDIMAMNLSFPYASMPHTYQLKIRQSYYAATTYMDSMVGEVLHTLQEEGLVNNTIIAFLGDHGWSMGEHGEWSKYSNYEISTRVPLIVSVPQVTQPDISQPLFKYIDPFDWDSSHSTKVGGMATPQYCDKLIELVDLFPSLVELAGLPGLSQCPKDSGKVDTCTEGLSFKSLLTKCNASNSAWKNVAFSQYPRPSVYPKQNSDKPRLKDIKYMGYSVRTTRYRYTEWVQFDNKAFKPNWTSIQARELYDYDLEKLEINNVVDKPAYQSTVKYLADLLHKGWYGKL